MSLVDQTSLTTRLAHRLPPTAPLPATLQTLACRWWPFAYLERCRARYGDRFTVYPVDMPPLVFLSSPADIRAVITTPSDTLHPGAGGDLIAPLFGESSFVLREEDEHLSVRNELMPAFHQRAVQRHADMVADVVGEEIASWPLDTVFPVHTRLQSLTLKLILNVLIDGVDPVFDALHGCMLEMQSTITSLVLQEPRLRYLPGWHHSWSKFVRLRSDADKLIFALIDRRRRDGEDRGDLLDTLLASRDDAGAPMSDRQIRDNLVSLIIAGHETTAATLAWAFQLLAHNPAAQDRLTQELDDDAGSEYTDATIQETLRHKPTFLFITPRKVAKPLEIGGWTYRPPVLLLGCTYLMHHDPELYPDPHEFRPERFLDWSPKAGSWLPWGGGYRRCPGRHLALLQMQTVLRAVFATRRAQPAGPHVEHPRWRSAILAPHAGARIVLRARGSSRDRRAGAGRAADHART